MTAERPDPREQPAAAKDEAAAAAGETGEAYSEDEEAAVAARLEDLGYI